MSVLAATFFLLFIVFIFYMFYCHLHDFVETEINFLNRKISCLEVSISEEKYEQIIQKKMTGLDLRLHDGFQAQEVCMRSALQKIKDEIEDINNRMNSCHKIKKEKNARHATIDTTGPDDQ